MIRISRPSDGSAIVAVLTITALLSIMLVAMFQGVRLDRRGASLAADQTTARLAAESGLAAAMARLSICTATHPAFVTGLAQRENAGDVLVIATNDLGKESQLVPLFSCDPGPLSSYPKLPADYALHQLSNSLSTNPTITVDLNDPAWEHPSRIASTNEAGDPGLIGPSGRHPALWQNIADASGTVLARYAYLMADESACLNPLLHGEHPRNDPTDWDHGPGDLPLTNAAGSLLSPDEADHLRHAAPGLPTVESYAVAFAHPDRFATIRHLITRDPCLLPDIIPAGYPEGGLPKYNINDLATNPAWGSTPWARATNLAAIIDRNLPQFKMRDPSLTGSNSILYLQRLASSVIDYISPTTTPTGPSADLPLGRDLVPYVTQIAERCLLKNLTSNSATIESRYFIEVWNPTLSTIPEIPDLELTISHRPLVTFGDGVVTPFRDYHGHSGSVRAIRPNEFVVIAFAPEEQTWSCPTSSKLTKHPFPEWGNGPQGNEGNLSQAFCLSRAGQVLDRNRPAGLSPGDQPGGMAHFGKTLSNNAPVWQCMIVPTQSMQSSGPDDQTDADEAITPGRYRAVGDPRQNLYTSYLWGKPYTNYPILTLWNGINPAGVASSGGILDPRDTWTGRDPVPVNPATGIHPSGNMQDPDRIATSYVDKREEILAPSVIRKGPMTSLGELGNIYDPAQADDQGEAPKCGADYRKNVFGSGGGRTLRFGQPEFRFPTQKTTWDIPGKRALDLIDLFTIRDKGRSPDSKEPATNAGIPGRINVNTAPHEVLTALFTGIAVTSDRRFTNSILRASVAEELATRIEEQRPFNRLSDLGILTPELVNAESYQPALSRNLPGSSPPAADVFDRAREEGFSKVIGHCAVQSRTFRVVVIGQALNRHGQPRSTAVGEGIIRLTPDARGILVPSLHDTRWY